MAHTIDRETVSLRLVKIAMREYEASEGVLAGRDRGDSAWRDIERRIAKVDDDHLVALDFEGVRAISVPFADACLGRLLSGKLSGFYEDHPLAFLNADEDVRETISAALQLRNLFALCLASDGPHLLGGDETLIQTMQAAFELRNFSVHQLADELRLSPQAANNRLRALTRSGALQRERVHPRHGGREFRYRVPEAQDAA